MSYDRAKFIEECEAFEKKYGKGVHYVNPVPLPGWLRRRQIKDD